VRAWRGRLAVIGFAAGVRGVACQAAAGPVQRRDRLTESQVRTGLPAGFEPSVPRVMDGELGRQVPALIAVFELAGTAVALQRGTKVVWPHRHPEFP
jgi:hypothetical protein